VRRALDALYLGAGWLAALSMIGVLAMVLTSIVTRQIGVHVPGTDAYAGYFMAGAGFLALAHTLKRGEHIRVSLLLNALHGGARRSLELWSLAVATVLAGAFAFYSVRLAWQSRLFNDVSTGNDATPLWIPQIAMAAGTMVLLVALVDELVLELRGKRQPPSPAAGEEASHNE
jgi:TRAP-type C4-dicarboxylate transport system permease small subunit